MNKLNRNIVNIINNYIKPLYYLKELEESIKDIKYDRIKLIDDYIIHRMYYVESGISKKNNKWERNEYVYLLDYRIKYLQNR